MGGSPWQHALASIGEALADSSALESARAAALELAVPAELKAVQAYVAEHRH